MQKESLHGHQVTDTLREKFKNKPWLLEDETGQFQYHGHLEGTQATTYYLLMLRGKEIVAIPAGSWYNFSKVAQYKQLTLEEAEVKMKNRRSADGYQSWMMKSACNGAAAFGEVEKFDDEDAEAARKNRLGLNKKNWDDDEEGSRGGDIDFDDDNIEKGDDWEHEEIFTDDDEAVGIYHEDREDLAPEIPAPPEIKQDDEDEDEADEEEGEGGLSKSGKELKKLLERSNRLYGYTEDDTSPVITPKKEAPKEEPVDNKATTSAAGRGTPSTSKSSKGKRKISGKGSKTPNTTPLKKVKTENGLKPVKDENDSSSTSGASSQSMPAPPTGPVIEAEIRAFILQRTRVTTRDISDQFKSRLMLQEERGAFSAMMKRISKIQRKTEGGPGFLLLKERYNLM